MYVPVLNYFIDIEEAIVVLCVVIIAYMGVLHLEFRQLRIISKRFGEEDGEFTKSIRELRSDLNSLGDIVKGIELDNISRHVDGTASAPKKKSTFRPKDLVDAKDPENSEDTVSGTKNMDAKKNVDPKSDAKSLKDKLEEI